PGRPFLAVTRVRLDEHRRHDVVAARALVELEGLDAVCLELRHGRLRPEMMMRVDDGQPWIDWLLADKVAPGGRVDRLSGHRRVSCVGARVRAASLSRRSVSSESRAP